MINTSRHRGKQCHKLFPEKRAFYGGRFQDTRELEDANGINFLDLGLASCPSHMQRYASQLQLVSAISMAALQEVDHVDYHYLPSFSRKNPNQKNANYNVIAVR
jgi:hypothetical protein